LTAAITNNNLTISNDTASLRVHWTVVITC